VRARPVHLSRSSRVSRLVVPGTMCPMIHQISRDLAGLHAPLPLGLHACHIEAGGRLLIARLESERLGEGGTRAGGVLLGLERDRQLEVPLRKFGFEPDALERVLPGLGVPDE